MKMPPNSASMAQAIERIHRTLSEQEANTLDYIDDIAKSGFSDKRWCAVARTDIEKGFMAAHRALRDYPGEDENNYGKIPLDQPLPRAFDPPPDPEVRRQVAPTHQIDWKDYGPGEVLDPPDKPQPE